MAITKQDIRDAYLQLKRHFYYEKFDLLNRHKIVQFENEHNFKLESCFNTILTWINDSVPEDGIDFDIVDDFITGITINHFVKKVTPSHKSLGNFITDKVESKKDIFIEKQHVFAEIPIEVQILGVLWLNTVGQKLEKRFSSHSYGNRLIKKNEEEEDFAQNGKLYKIFHHQYVKWWKKGLKKAQSILSDDHQDVIILSFDLKNYYHNIRFNQTSLRELIGFGNLSHEEKFLHLVLEEVLKWYNGKEELPAIKSPEQVWSLPIGYIASPVLANLYLNNFDKEIINNVRPDYYGRYVDDILFVFRSTIPKSDSKKLDEATEILERYGLSADSQNNESNYRFFKYLGDYVKFNEESREFSLTGEGINGLVLNSDKLFVYDLDKLSPNSIIEKFVVDQEAKNYEFQYESEEKDKVSDDFGDLLFHQNFESDDATSAKLKGVNDNKFQISVFLARLIRRASQGNLPDSKQLKKIVSYYKSSNCIVNWPLWEKIILALVVCNEKGLLISFLKSTLESINKVDSTELDNINPDLIERDLKRILEISLANAIAAVPSFDSDSKLSKFYSKEESQKIRRSAFTRNEYHVFPLIGLVKKAIEGDVSYLHRTELMTFISGQRMVIDTFLESYCPLFVKYWQIYMIHWENKLNGLRLVAGDHIKRTYLSNLLSYAEVHNPAFHQYYLMNFGKTNRTNLNRIQEKYFFKAKDAVLKSKKKGRVDREPESYGLAKHEFKITGQLPKEKLKFALVNEDVKRVNYLNASQGKPEVKGRLKKCFRILDEAQAKHADIVIQPELSVPYDFLTDYCSYSDRHQLGIVAGVEHKRIKDVVFNFILTVLPIKVDGFFNDAIPIIRLKNHYAPIEEEMINGFRATVPKPMTYLYHLINWKGLYFTNYYCYELADINHRTIFQGEIDALLAPVWNLDTNYYNSIIESGARELHCVFSQVNTSEYGDTRWTLPSKTEKKNPIKVKGGTTHQHPYTIAIAEFEPSKLRAFQNLDFSAQKKNDQYKPTPPDYPKDKAIKREKNEAFYIK